MTMHTAHTQSIAMGKLHESWYEYPIYFPYLAPSVSKHKRVAGGKVYSYSCEEIRETSYPEGKKNLASKRLYWKIKNYFAKKISINRNLYTRS